MRTATSISRPGNYGQQNVVYCNRIPASEIRVEATLEILSGDATPSTSDWTDFGSTAVAGAP
jgi:hypothetical protein